MPVMDGIEVIETEWGSELHRRLIAEKHAARVAYRDSPEAWEQHQELLDAPRLEWQGVIPAKKARTVPIYRW